MSIRRSWSNIHFEMVYPLRFFSNTVSEQVYLASFDLGLVYLGGLVKKVWRSIGKGLVVVLLHNFSPCLILVLRKICGTRISEFVKLEKNWVWKRIFRPNFKFKHYIFHISIVQTWFLPEFSLVRIVGPKKLGIGHQFFIRILTLSDLFDPNLTWTRIFTNTI